MSLPEDWIRNGVLGTGGVFGLRWLYQVWRGSRRDFQGDQSESTALKNMKAEIARLADRVGSLEKKLDERDQEVEAERKLRRIAEDELDQERRRSAALEDRIAELESDCGET
jgi:chromosome segregation ATPase